MIEALSGTNSRQLPFIVLTANATKLAEKEALEAGAQAFLTKPVQLESLLAAVSRVANIAPSDQVHLSGATTADNGPEDRKEAKVKDLPILDETVLNNLKALGSGDADFLRMLVRCFIEDTESGLPAIRAALDRKDYREVYEVAHGLVSTAGHVGAVRQANLFRMLQRTPPSEMGTRGEGLVKELEEEFTVARGALEAHIRLRSSSIPS
jgi:two-component system sensor histidine kinase RpfC